MVSSPPSPASGTAASPVIVTTGASGGGGSQLPGCSNAAMPPRSGDSHAASQSIGVAGSRRAASSASCDAMRPLPSPSMRIAAALARQRE